MVIRNKFRGLLGRKKTKFFVRNNACRVFNVNSRLAKNKALKPLIPTILLFPTDSIIKYPERLQSFKGKSNNPKMLISRIFHDKLLLRLKRHLISYRVRFFAFLSCLHHKGNKTRAELFMVAILLIIKSKVKCSHVFSLVNICFDILEPFFFIRNFRRYGQVCLIPVTAVRRKRCFLAMHFLVSSAVEQRKVTSKSMIELIANEMIILLKKETRKDASSFKLKRLFIKKAFANRFSCRFLRVNVSKVTL